MSAEKRAFYEFHACMMEPWDGPASIAFTDGKQIGAVLDRNGLAPSRYYITRTISSSWRVKSACSMYRRIACCTRPVAAGRMFLVDLEQGRVIADGELKHQIATQQPYGEWLKPAISSVEELPEAPEVDRRILKHCCGVSGRSGIPPKT